MKQKLLLIVQMIVLVCVVGLIFSPAFQAEPCLLDDMKMLKNLQTGAHVGIVDFFSQSSSYLIYFRPLIGFSYWCDQTLWNADPHVMHSENVVFHALNVVLLFWLIRFSLPKASLFSSYAPFSGALFFAVHPISTESVNWISGRTDLLAGACLISATIFLMAWQRNRERWWMLLLTMVLVTGAVMAKEVAWGFVLVLPFFMVAPHDSVAYPLSMFWETLSRLEKLLVIMLLALGFFLVAVMLSFWPVIILSIIFAFWMSYRKPRGALVSRKVCLIVPGVLLLSVWLLPGSIELLQRYASHLGSSQLLRTLYQITSDIENTIRLFSAAIAFYGKKFIIPLPLSFSIPTIATEYLFGGIAIIFLTIFLAIWRSQAALLFLAGIALLMPALPLVHNQISWTPYAERYIYISSGLWIAASIIGVNSIRYQYVRTLFVALCIALIPVNAYITWKRSTIWQTNVSLFGDTVQKSPVHLEARLLYMIALSRAARFPEAMDEFRRIQANPGSWRYIRYFNDLVELYCKNGVKDYALEVVEMSLAIPLPRGQKHPLQNNEWQRLYKLKTTLQQGSSAVNQRITN